MDFNEYIDAFGRWKKKRKLRDIIVDEITLAGSPANRKTFAILKGKKMNEIIKLIKKFIGREFEVGKAVDSVKVKEALKTLLQYSEDFPAELKDSLDTILNSAYGFTAEKSQNDDFPSICIVGPQKILEKMAGIEDDDLTDEDDDDDEIISEWDE